MEHSQYIEPMNKHSTRRADAVKAVIRGLVTHSLVKPEPFYSEHYKPVEVPIIERTDIAQLHGWDAFGEYK